MSNPTSNFGWQMPTNSDLVTDLPADFEVFGQGVDTTLADLKGGTSGQILSKNTNADMDFVWINNDQGDITSVTATSPLTGGGTSGAITVGIQAASTTQSGAVQLTDSTSSTSTLTAATPNSVKTAYDLANAAVPNTRTISTTSPLSGGGALSGNLTLSVGAGSTSTAGVLQLTDSTSSTSTTTAATPNSVKSAYDPAFTNNFYAGKNKIINGDFGIWQRGTSFSPTSASTIYTADRWANYNNGSGIVTASQQTFTVGTAPVAGYEGTYFHRIAFPASLGTTTQYVLEQRIEDVRTFAGQTVTFSFWMKLGASQSTPFASFLAAQNFGSGGSAKVDTNFTVPSLTTSWARYSATITIPSISGKTIGTNSYLSIYFSFNAQASQTIDIWGAQLEAGSTATPFQTATGNKQAELAACQRYYWRVSPPASSAPVVSNGMATSTTAFRISAPTKQTMRVVPTSVDWANLTIADGLTGYAVSAITFGASTDAVDLQITSSGLTQFRGGWLVTTNSSGYLGWSAEL